MNECVHIDCLFIHLVLQNADSQPGMYLLGTILVGSGISD